MGDMDSANDFAKGLKQTYDGVKKECAKVSADCIERKQALDKALVGL